jgi:hypothetical protein
VKKAREKIEKYFYLAGTFQLFPCRYKLERAKGGQKTQRLSGQIQDNHCKSEVVTANQRKGAMPQQ